jgi:Rieske Fe-S protein
MVAPYRVDQLVPDAKGNWPAPFDFGGQPCLLVKTSDGTVRAINAVCTHLQCTVTFRVDKQDIYCNCHNGVFSAEGKNVSGPPPKPLETFKVTLQGTSGQENIIVSRG